MTPAPPVRLLPPVLAFAALFAASDALACGGFFCSQTPIDQAGESIVFSMDPATGKVDTHVQITYEGEAADFAWVVPVPTLPSLFLSTDQLFSTLAANTAPVFNVTYTEQGSCEGYYYGSGYGDYDASSSSSYADTGGPGGVTIVATQTVGPYDTVTLQAQSSQQLLTWLQDNGYDLPDQLDPLLAPYVANDAYFVALKLQNDKSAGDIAPFGMRYDGQKAGIPIQLTSIAATPDMRLKVYVFGEHRAVPESYLHVQLNDVALNYIDRGTNYEQVITRAADEAGGQAFATDFAGDPSFLQNALNPDRYDTAALAALTDPVDFMNEVISQGFPSDETLLSLLMIHIPIPPQLAYLEQDPTQFYNCLECYREYLLPFDPAAFAAELQEVVIDPLVNAEALFEYPWLSRMTSSISPTEMTVDPVFVLNPDMGLVSNVREAEVVYLCGNGKTWDESARRLELSDGRVLLLPSHDWLDDNGLTLDEFLENLTDINALIIEKTGASGPPEVLQDFTDQAAAEDDENNHWVQDEFGEEEPDDGTSGCGCNSTTTGAPLAWGMALMTLILRRRRKD